MSNIPENYRLKTKGKLQAFDMVWIKDRDQWFDGVMIAMISPDISLSTDVGQLYGIHSSIMIVEFAPGELSCEEFFLIDLVSPLRCNQPGKVATMMDRHKISCSDHNNSFWREGDDVLELRKEAEGLMSRILADDIK